MILDSQGNPIRWITAENDQPNVGDCTLVGAANLRLKRTGVRMSDGEILHAYSVIAGWRPMDITTNRGATIPRVLDYWRDEGWPGDPLDKIAGWSEVPGNEIRAAIERDGAIVGWSMLPVFGGDYSFDDAALGMDGIAAHTTAMIQADDAGLTLITWGYEQRVSWGWWARFGRRGYRVELPPTVIA
jgi:hypothetical protein